jgi:hypothetical protein
MRTKEKERAKVFNFFSTAKKSYKKMPRLRKTAKNHYFSLKTVNSQSSDSTVFLTKKTLIFLTPFS